VDIANDSKEGEWREQFTDLHSKFDYSINGVRIADLRDWRQLHGADLTLRYETENGRIHEKQISELYILPWEHEAPQAILKEKDGRVLLLYAGNLWYHFPYKGDEILSQLRDRLGPTWR
jgi:hypothetical protein